MSAGGRPPSIWCIGYLAATATGPRNRPADRGNEDWFLRRSADPGRRSLRVRGRGWQSMSPAGPLASILRMQFQTSKHHVQQSLFVDSCDDLFVTSDFLKPFTSCAILENLFKIPIVT